MLIIVIFITFLVFMWALIWIYYKQRQEIEALKKELKARPKLKSNDDGLHPDIKAIAKQLNVSYQRAEEIYNRRRKD